MNTENNHNQNFYLVQICGDLTGKNNPNDLFTLALYATDNLTHALDYARELFSKYLAAISIEVKEVTQKEATRIIQEHIKLKQGLEQFNDDQLADLSERWYFYALRLSDNPYTHSDEIKRFTDYQDAQKAKQGYEKEYSQVTLGFGCESVNWQKQIQLNKEHSDHWIAENYQRSQRILSILQRRNPEQNILSFFKE